MVYGVLVVKFTNKILSRTLLVRKISQDNNIFQLPANMYDPTVRNTNSASQNLSPWTIIYFQISNHSFCLRQRSLTYQPNDKVWTFLRRGENRPTLERWTLSRRHDDGFNSNTQSRRSNPSRQAIYPRSVECREEREREREREGGGLYLQRGRASVSAIAQRDRYVWRDARRERARARVQRDVRATHTHTHTHGGQWRSASTCVGACVRATRARDVHDDYSDIVVIVEGTIARQ